MTTMKRATPRVTARYRRINRVSPGEVLRMFSIFQCYYENADINTFLADMSKKTGVFLLHRKSDRQIVGFSTVAKMDMDIDGRRIKGVFSGDTIIEREYWGSRALPLAFFLYLVRVILRHPLTPVFWLLISKGYKTYLLMANNFFRFYPHPQQRYDEYQPLIPQYCERLFPGYYDATRGVLDFGDQYQRLKSDVAPITEDLKAAHPSIAFFEQCNPEWRRGTELPCVGRAGFPDAFRYLFRYLKKLWRKPGVVQGAASGECQTNRDMPIHTGSGVEAGSEVDKVAVCVRVKHAATMAHAEASHTDMAAALRSSQ